MPFLFQLFVILGLLFVIYVGWVSKRGAPSLGSALVLRDFQVNDHASEGAVIIIRGRVSGLVAWMLTIIGIDTETTLTVTTDRVSVQQASLSGRNVVQVPLATVASTQSAYYQPVWALLAAGYFVLVGVAGAVFFTNSYESGSKERFILGGLIWGIIFVVVYVLGRKIGVSVETAGGQKIGIAFKPSVIEGVSVDLDSALRVAAVMNTFAMRAANNRSNHEQNPVGVPVLR